MALYFVLCGKTRLDSHVEQVSRTLPPAKKFADDMDKPCIVAQVRWKNSKAKGWD